MKTSEWSSFPTLRTRSCLTRKEFYSNFPCCLRSEPSSPEIFNAPGLIIPSMPGTSKVLYIRGAGVSMLGKTCIMAIVRDINFYHFERT